MYFILYLGEIAEDIDLAIFEDVTQLDGSTKPFTYGMVHCGAPTHQASWKQGRMLFNIDDTLRSDSTHYHPNMHRLNYHKLDPIDLLAFQSSEKSRFDDHFWSQWFSRKMKTSILLLFFPEEHVLRENGEAWKRLHRLIRHHKYNIQFDLVEAEKCGASSREKYFVSFCTLANIPYKQFNIDKEYVDLPSRTSENSIKHYLNLKRGFHAEHEITPLSRNPIHHTQSNLLGSFQTEPIYDMTGPIGGQFEKQFIFIPGKGFRRLLKDEWMKLRGYEPIDGVSVSMRGIIKSIPSHVWATLTSFTQKLLLPPVQDKAGTIDPSPNCTHTSSSTAEDSTWTWEPPPLNKDSEFRRDSIKRLVSALEAFPESERDSLFREGLDILEKHSENFTENGIKHLVLLWWHWPCEHWVELCKGISMNFIETPTPAHLPNQNMNEHDLSIACQFMDELIDLGVFLKCKKEDILLNFPLFVVPKPKPEQKGEYRCIADGKKGGQNAACIPDPVQMTAPEHILPHMYRGGYSTILDMSKYFHMFKTVESEQAYMGVFHPRDGEAFKYGQCPMGSRNSPGGTGRSGFSFIRYIIENSPLFSRDRFENNSFVNLFEERKVYDPDKGEGRIFFSPDGTLAILIWLHVDDILVHGPTKEKVEEALTYVVSTAMYFGLVIQPVKVELPSQIVRYCGFQYNTTDIPTLEIPDYKLTRASTMVKYLLSGSYTRLARQTLSVCLGNLQSLVPATFNNIGAVFLRSLYNDLHNYKQSPLYGSKLYYFTTVNLSPESVTCLHWWKDALANGLRRQSYPQDYATIAVTFGDGSHTGAGGTSTMISNTASVPLPKLDVWMGVWKGMVHSFTSNWRELRTLEITLQLELNNKTNRVRNRRLFYFTDNQVTYDISHSSSSPIPELMKLITNIRLLELKLGCHLEVIHVPGVVLIDQGSDGFSRGLIPSSLATTSAYNPMSLLFRAALPSIELLSVCLHVLNLPQNPYIWKFWDAFHSWTPQALLHSSNFWTVPSNLARQAILSATYGFCETPLSSQHIFVIPRLQLRQFHRINRYYHVYGPFWDLPVGFTPLVPFVIIYLPPHCRITQYYREKQNKTKPQHLDMPPSFSEPGWITSQVENMYGLS